MPQCGAHREYDRQRGQEMRQRVDHHRRVVLIDVGHVRKHAEDRGNQGDADRIAYAPETRNDDAVDAHQKHPFRHLKEGHEVVILRVVIQPAGPETAEVVSENRVLDIELVDVVVIEGEIRHLEPEGENVDDEHGEECPLARRIDAAPPLSDGGLHRRTKKRSHRRGRVTLPRSLIAPWDA